MKLLLDFLPILVFFIAYKIAGIYIATAAAILVSIIQVIYIRLRYRRVEWMQLVTLALIIIFGGATLLLHEVIFIQWKVTLVNWLFAAVFFGSHYIGKQPLIKRLLGPHVVLSEKQWFSLNMSWVLFFLGLGLVNLYVVYHFDTNIWVYFKLFGILGLTVVFVIAQSLVLNRWVKK